MTRHNDISDGFADIAGKSFIPLNVRNNLLIHQGRSVQEVKAHPEVSPPKTPPETTEK